jgi:hypothetical protein
MTKTQKSALADRLMSIELNCSAATGSRVASKPGSPVKARPRPKQNLSAVQVQKLNAFYEGTSLKTIVVK